MTSSFHHPPNTASSNHRFAAGSKKGGAPGKKAASTMRRYENSFVSNHEFSKPAKSVRPTATAAQRGQQPLTVSQTVSNNVQQVGARPTTPEKKILELQQLKKELNMQRR